MNQEERPTDHEKHNPNYFFCVLALDLRTNRELLCMIWSLGEAGLHRWLGACPTRKLILDGFLYMNERYRPGSRTSQACALCSLALVIPFLPGSLTEVRSNILLGSGV